MTILAEPSAILNVELCLFAIVDSAAGEAFVVHFLGSRYEMHVRQRDFGETRESR